MAKLEYFSIDNEFLNNRKISFSTGMNRLENDEENLYSMQISDKEKQLSDEEKISLVKKLWNSFDIECVYCKNVSEISNFRWKVFGINEKNDSDAIIELQLRNKKCMKK